MSCRAAVVACILSLAAPAVVSAQSCPEPLASARRLVLVVSENMASIDATMRLFERASPSDPWRPVANAEPAQVGRAGIAWSYFFRSFAAPGEPLKVEGDKRAPAGIYRLSRSFGRAPSSRIGYTQLTKGTVCVDDLASPAYNTISSRTRVGWTVHGENMWRVPEYRHGVFIDYPTNVKARAGSCVFIHIRVPHKNGTGGCVALPEARIEALQDFAGPATVIAILPRSARARLRGCLPALN